MVSGMLFGVLPAWRATRVNPAPSLKGTGTAGMASSPRLPLSRLLVSLQVGMSLLLLAGAGLFIRTLRQLSAVDLARLRENIAAIPSVESAAMSQHGLTQGVESDASVHAPGFRPADKG
jgi:hypothetical protein